MTQHEDATASTGVDGGGVTPAWVRRYLALLGLEAEPPSLDALARLTRAQIDAVPFENLSSLIRASASIDRPTPPVDPEVQLGAWEARRGGGICFEVADTFSRLLVALGYAAHPVLCQISFPGSHQAILVEVEGRRYLVDAGNGAPFFEPIPLSGEFEIRRAGLAYRFHAGETPEEWVQDRWIDSAWSPFCRYDLHHPDPETREAAYQRHHTPGQSWVVGSLVLIRSEDEAVWVLRDGEFTLHTAGGKRSQQVVDGTEYERLARDVFRLPALPIREGLAGYERLARRAKPATG